MAGATISTLQPRKTPVQARSSQTVDAILQATIQVLRGEGKERLTTTQVARRAGVSVGTLYQYFPNKSALLQAALKRHMDSVSRAMEQACEQNKSKGLLEMASSLIAAFLDAKMHDIEASVTLYAVSSDVDGAAISKAASEHIRHRVADLLATARERLRKDPDVVASVVLAALNGVARRVLEAKNPARAMESLRGELVVLVHAYLRTCTAEPIGDVWPSHRGNCSVEKRQLWRR